MCTQINYGPISVSHIYLCDTADTKNMHNLLYTEQNVSEFCFGMTPGCHKL